MSPSAALTRVLMLLVAVSLAGCGQKGDLYLPDREREVVTSVTTAPASGEEEDDPPAATPAPDAAGQ